MLEEYLKYYVIATQKNWVDLIDIALLCYNPHKSSAIRISPFELTTRLQTRMPLDVAK